jgi:hypothetical protein
MVKVLISYDMREGREEECQRYVMQTLGPGMAQLGLRITDAWYTLWGNAPQIMGGGVLDSEEEASRMIYSQEWGNLIDGLRPLVDNFRIRVIDADGRFQY